MKGSAVSKPFANWFLWTDETQRADFHFVFHFDLSTVSRRNAVQRLYVLITMIDFAVCVGGELQCTSPDTQRGNELKLYECFFFYIYVYIIARCNISMNYFQKSCSCLYNEFFSRRLCLYLSCCASLRPGGGGYVVVWRGRRAAPRSKLTEWTDWHPELKDPAFARN